MPIHWCIDIIWCLYVVCGTGVATFFFFFLGATPAAYGGSQAQDRIGALAAGYNHNNTGFEPHPHPTPQLTAMPDP